MTASSVSATGVGVADGVGVPVGDGRMVAVATFVLGGARVGSASPMSRSVRGVRVGAPTTGASGPIVQETQKTPATIQAAVHASRAGTARYDRARRLAGR